MATGPRTILTTAACTAAVALALSFPGAAESRGRATGAPRRTAVRSELSPPLGGALQRARGRILLRRSGARDLVALEMTGLARRARYTISCDDPTTAATDPAPFAEVRTGRGRKGRVVLGTGSRRPLPHDASLEELAGSRIEVRDEAGRLVLSGEVPSVSGEGSGEPPASGEVECRFLEDVVLEDTFDDGTAGEAPANWDVAGTDVDGIEVEIDDQVFDGESGASVRLADTVAADPGSPSMARSFTAQDGFFAVEFTLFAGTADGRTVFQVADSTADPDAVPTGLGDGLGLYEDGTLGFGIDDAIQTVAADAKLLVRVDFDLAAGKFDVSVDGATAVTGRDLGFSGTSLDRISFAGTPSTTGTAWVDTVRVIHKSLDCAPTANAGTDQVVECSGTATEVTLDGTGSSDPEGAELTYTWTGDFEGGTATGAAPTVKFAGHGPFEVSLVVNDGFFDSAADTVAIEVEDTTPPELSVTGLPTELWPPNHQMIAITPRVVATDLCDGDRVRLALEITSNEVANGRGDGNTEPDWAVRSPSDFDLRAERAGPGSGRVYTLVWTAADSSGNRTTVEARVLVPHDQGHGGGAGDDHGNGPPHDVPRGRGRGPK